MVSTGHDDVKKEDWGVTWRFCTLLFEKRCWLVFEKIQRHYVHVWGTRILPRKTLSRGLFENPAYTLRGETTCPSANIPASQHQREGPGRSFNRKGLPRASPKSDKSTFLVRTYSGAMMISYSWTTPWDLTYVRSLHKSCTQSRPINHTEHAARVCLEIAAAWAEQSRVMITNFKVPVGSGSECRKSAANRREKVGPFWFWAEFKRQKKKKH